MKQVTLLLIIILLFSSTIYAQNLEVQLYQESNGAKDYGNIKAKPGDSVKAFIEVKNTNNDRSNEDQDIQDIYVTVTIEGILDGEDYEEEFDNFDLRATRDNALEINFNIPLKIQEGDHDIIIDYEGYENGVDFSDSTGYLLTIEKEKNDIRINKFEFQPAEIKCNEVSNLNIDMTNLGSSDENVDLTIENQELKYISRKSIELQSYPRVDDYVAKIPIKFSQDSTYTFDLTAKYSNLIEKDQAAVTVDCSDVPQTTTPTVSIKEQTQTEDATTKTTQAPKNIPKSQIVVNQNSNTPLIILVSLIVLAVILAIVIITIKKK